MQSTFREKFTYSKRVELSERIRNRHYSKVPVIVDRAANTPNLPLLEKQKYLTPQHFTMANFTNEILQQLPVQEQSHICFYVGNGVRAMPAMLMQQVYEQYKDTDGFLYVTYGEHKTFGGL